MALRFSKLHTENDHEIGCDESHPTRLWRLTQHGWCECWGRGLYEYGWIVRRRWGVGPRWGVGGRWIVRRRWIVGARRGVRRRRGVSVRRLVIAIIKVHVMGTACGVTCRATTTEHYCPDEQPQSDCLFHRVFHTASFPHVRFVSLTQQVTI